MGNHLLLCKGKHQMSKGQVKIFIASSVINNISKN